MNWNASGQLMGETGRLLAHDFLRRNHDMVLATVVAGESISGRRPGRSKGALYVHEIERL